MGVWLHRVWFILWFILPWVVPHILYAQVFEKNIALVIGNTEYTQLPRLRNASRDAFSVARALSEKGFTVFFAKDVTAIKLKEIIAFVSARAENADQVVIYYAGHNEIRNGTTQLIPINTTSSSSNTHNQSLSIPELLDTFDIPFAKKAFILDTCLQDPPETYGSGAETLSLPKALGMETLLVFATSFGQAAYDGVGDHSIFTGALLDYMAKDKFDIQSAVQSVRRDVIEASRASQVPVSLSTLTQPFILDAHAARISNMKSQNNLVQSYSSSGYAGKPLLDIISSGMNPAGF
jgi:uncharacterized caspase-like protein